MNWVKSFYFRQIAIVLAFGIFLIGSIPAESMAYVVGSESVEAAMVDRSADMATVQRVLESKIISQKLGSLGLTHEEINERLDKLTNDELHQFAGQLDSLYPGGDALSTIVVLLIIAILVLVLLKMTNKKIIIK